MIRDSVLETVDGRSLSVGVVGAGNIARLFHLPILSNLDNIHIKFISDIDEEKLERLATTYSDRSIATSDPNDLPDCDIILLTIPVGVREEYIGSFGERGTAIFSEKPFAKDPANHTKFEEGVSKIFCNYMRLNFQSTRQLRFLIQSGILGPLERIKAREGEIVGATGKHEGHYQTDVSKSGGGVLIQNGCHLLSQLAFVFGDREISVKGSCIECHGPFDIDIDAELSVRGDVPVDLQISRVRDLPNRLEFLFEDGSISVNPSEPEATVHLSADLEQRLDTVTLNQDNNWAQNLTQAHYLRWREFIDWIIGKEPEPPLPTGYRVTELIDSIYKLGGVARAQ